MAGQSRRQVAMHKCCLHCHAGPMSPISVIRLTIQHGRRDHGHEVCRSGRCTWPRHPLLGSGLPAVSLLGPLPHRCLWTPCSPLLPCASPGPPPSSCTAEITSAVTTPPLPPSSVLTAPIFVVHMTPSCPISPTGINLCFARVTSNLLHPLHASLAPSYAII